MACIICTIQVYFDFLNYTFMFMHLLHAHHMQTPSLATEGTVCVIKSLDSRQIVMIKTSDIQIYKIKIYVCADILQ